jgi:serine/threonine protein kinase
MIYIQHGQQSDRGSFAVVHPALEVDDETGACRQVAVKRMRGRSEFPRGRKEDLLYATAARLFERERKVWCTLSPHPGLVPALRATRIDGEPVLVLEYIYGATLEEILERPNGPLHPIDLIDLCDQLASALRHLHEVCRITHGDVSPHNIFNDGTGVIQISDFSLAVRIGERPAETPQFALTLEAPEQKHALDVTPAVDTWKAAVCILLAARGESLGSVFLGDPDFAGGRSWKTDVAKSVERATRGMDDKEWRHSLTDFLLRALARDPAQRFANGGELDAGVRDLMSRNPLWSRLLEQRRNTWNRLRLWSTTSPHRHGEALRQLSAIRAALLSGDFITDAHRLLPQTDYLLAHAAWLSSTGKRNRPHLLELARSHAQSSFEIFDGDPRPLEIIVKTDRALRQGEPNDGIDLRRARDLIRLFTRFKTFVRAHQVRELVADLVPMADRGNQAAATLLAEARKALIEFDERLLQHYKNLEDRLPERSLA